MCLSRLGQIIYGILAFATIALIAASMFTSAWRSMKLNFNQTMGSFQNGSVPDLTNLNFGIFICQLPTNYTANATMLNGTSSPSTSSQPFTNMTANSAQQIFNNSFDYCKVWWTLLTNWERVVIVAMCLALGTALLAFLWNIISFCACFCKGGIMKPLPGMAGLTAIFLAIALGVFYYNNQGYIESMKVELANNNTDIGQNVKDAAKQMLNFINTLDQDGNKVSYSFYLGCGAAIVAFANMILGSIIVCLSDKCL